MSFKNNLLQRGFKAEAQRQSEQFRKDIGLQIYDPLDAFRLAEHSKVTVYNIDEIGLSLLLFAFIVILTFLLYYQFR